MKSMAHQFLDFVKSKPAAEAYNFFACDECAFSQFLRAYGYAAEPTCSNMGWRDLAKDELPGTHPLPDAFALPGRCEDAVLAEFPWTFGALAERLEAALAS